MLNPIANGMTTACWSMVFKRLDFLAPEAYGRCKMEILSKFEPPDWSIYGFLSKFEPPDWSMYGIWYSSDF